MAVNVKMGADMAGFRNGIANAYAQLKTFDAQMKLAESTFKATGNAEDALTNKTNALTGKLSTQRQMVQQYTTVLKAMKDSGVEPLSKEYQQLEAQLLKVQAGMMDTEAALNDLSTTQLEAANSADKLTQSVNGIGRKISLDQVISGIGTITTSLEKAAQKATQLGETIWANVMDSARWADDTATMALMYGIDLDTFQRMQKLVTNGLDTSVESVLKAQKKLKSSIGGGGDSIMATLRELNLLQTQEGKYGPIELIPEDSVDLFWEAGRAIMALGDEYEQENKAQQLFGKSWNELIDLFTKFASRDEYEKALKNVRVNSEEEVNALADLYDKVGELKGNIDTLSREVWGAMAPALTEAANALNGVLETVLDYLEKPEGQEMLNQLGDAINGLFADMSEIDPEMVVQGFIEAFTTVTGGIQWLVNNAEAAKGILGTIVATWGTLKLTGGALAVFQLIQGITGLAGGGAASTAGQAGAAAGAAWGAGFADAVVAAAPWLIGLWTLLNPDLTPNGNNDLADANGTLTAEGWSDFLWQRERASNGQTQDNVWFNLINELGEVVQASANLWDDPQGIQALARYLNSGDMNQLINELVALGYVLREEDTGPVAYTNGQAQLGRANPNSPIISKALHDKRLKPGQFIVEDLSAEETAALFGSAGNQILPDRPGVFATIDSKTGRLLPGQFIVEDLSAEETAALFGSIGNQTTRKGAISGQTLKIEPGQFIVEDLSAEETAALFGDFTIPAELEIPEDTAKKIAEDVGTVIIPGQLIVEDLSDEETAALFGSHANGLWSVPRDNYLALLHKGEQVIPAREVAASRNYSSNLYVESMYMNNGQDAEGLAARMAAAQRRTMSGYGAN